MVQHDTRTCKREETLALTYPYLSTYTSPYIHIYLHMYYGFAHLPPCWEGVFVCLSAVFVVVVVVVVVVVDVAVWEGKACENGARERK